MSLPNRFRLPTPSETPPELDAAVEGQAELEYDRNDPTTWPATMEEHLAKDPGAFKDGVPPEYQQDEGPQLDLGITVLPTGIMFYVFVPNEDVIDARASQDD